MEGEYTKQILPSLSRDENDNNNRKSREDDCWRDSLSQFEYISTNEIDNNNNNNNDDMTTINDTKKRR